MTYIVEYMTLQHRSAFFKVVVAFTDSMPPDRESFLHDQDLTSLRLLAASL